MGEHLKSSLAQIIDDGHEDGRLYRRSNFTYRCEILRSSDVVRRLALHVFLIATFIIITSFSGEKKEKQKKKKQKKKQNCRLRLRLLHIIRGQHVRR
jgi:hypothetical protein